MTLPEDIYSSIASSETHAPLLNIGCGEDLTVRELAELIRDVAGFKGRLVFDTTKPDGTPRKLLDVSRMKKLGWQAATPLRKGVEAVYADYAARPVEAAGRTST
jgi:GDP-L-fucose synthase